MTIQIEDIREAEARLDELKSAYLKRWGWKETCNTPGAFWMWQRDFAAEDAERREWWLNACASNPPYGDPSEPRPYGVITASTDTAIAMTERGLSA